MMPFGLSLKDDMFFCSGTGVAEGATVGLAAGVAVAVGWGVALGERVLPCVGVVA